VISVCIIIGTGRRCNVIIVETLIPARENVPNVVVIALSMVHQARKKLSKLLEYYFLKPEYYVWIQILPDSKISTRLCIAG
jgi:hypothetical protein